MIEKYLQKVHSILKNEFNGQLKQNASILVQQSKLLKKEILKKDNKENIDDILVVPSRYSRKTYRKYKQKNLGQWIKAIKLNELKIKKEKVEANKKKQIKVPKAEPKKRGRPKKII